MSKDYSGQTFVQPNHHDTYPFIDPRKQDLSGKYVFVSGASKGIGRALGIAYAQAGVAGIALGARSDLATVQDEVLQAAKDAGRTEPKVLSLSLDVVDLASVEAAAKATESAFGKLDILINNAGYLASFERITEGDPVEWWKTWEVNIKGRRSLPMPRVYNNRFPRCILSEKGVDSPAFEGRRQDSHQLE